MLRLLMVRPWLVGGRDDEAIVAVKRNLAAIREAFGRLGWVVVVERDLVRLRKSPPPRRADWAASAPSPLQASWFFLLVAGAESVAPRCGLAQLVTAARAAAADAGLPVTHDIVERRALVRALHMLETRGLVQRIEGDVDDFVEDEAVPILIAVHHTRLAHVIANYAPGDPVADPSRWLDDVEREPDAPRRMRRRLIDDTIVHAADLDDAESDWLRRRVRGDDGAPLAAVFGLHVERRAEGAAFVVPEDAFRYQHDLGDVPFPSPSTVQHAALLTCDRVRSAGATEGHPGRPGEGWRALAEIGIIDFLAETAARLAAGRGGWKRELADDPPRLASEVRGLLIAVGLVRMNESTWWFSPAIDRWQPSNHEVRAK